VVRKVYDRYLTGLGWTWTPTMAIRVVEVLYVAEPSRADGDPHVVRTGLIKESERARAYKQQLARAGKTALQQVGILFWAHVTDIYGPPGGPGWDVAASLLQRRWAAEPAVASWVAHPAPWQVPLPQQPIEPRAS